MEFNNFAGKGIAALGILATLAGLSLASVAAVVIAFGWVLNWLFPSITFGIACLIAGQVVFITGAIFGALSLSVFMDARLPTMDATVRHDEDFDDDDDDSDYTENLAELVAELTIQKLSQSVPSEMRYKATRPRRK